MERLLLKFLSSLCNKQRVKDSTQRAQRALRRKERGENLPLFSVADETSVVNSFPLRLRAAGWANRYRCAAAFACSG